MMVLSVADTNHMFAYIFIIYSFNLSYAFLADEAICDKIKYHENFAKN